MGLRINVSFKNVDEEIKLYNFAQGKRNSSVYIKDLIEADMNKEKISKPDVVSNNVRSVSSNIETLDF